MKNTKKTIITLIILVTVLMQLCTASADDVDEEEANDINTEINQEINEEIVSAQENTVPTLTARRCAIFDRNSKMLIYGKNENVKSAMASTTKILTALVVLEHDELNSIVTVSVKAGGTGGSRLGLRKGDKVTVHDLLYGLLLRSGNDAAVALAEYTGGDVNGFANLMNEKAKELNLQNSHFVTPHGLDNPEHFTTAKELAIITDYALDNKIFAEIVGTKHYTIMINNSPRDLNNTNELLGVLNGVVGVKTGFTNGAGRCLVTETKRGSRDIIVVVLGADTKKIRTKDSIKLIEYAYKNFAQVNIKEEAENQFENWKNINANRIKIIKANKNLELDLKLENFKKEQILVEKDKTNNITYTINSLDVMNAPVRKYTKVGNLIIKNGNNIIESIDIVANNDVEKKQWKDYFIEELKILHNW